MSIEKIIISVLASIIQSLGLLLVVFNLIPNKNKNDKIKFFIIMFIYGILSFYLVPNQIRFVLFITVIALIMKLILKLDGAKIILCAFFSTMIFSFSEILVTLFLIALGINSSEIVNDILYNFIANLLISMLSLGISCLPIIKNSLQKLNKIFTKNKNLVKYLYLLLVILYLIVLKNGFELILKANYYINILFMVSVILIITIIIRNEFKYDKIKDEYKNMLNHVTKYEKIITDQGKANHEFKNQLMVIRGYAQMNSPKLIEYLDSVIEDSKKTHSSYLISQLNKFPAGGIKGLLYYKLSTMDDENIKHELNVESGVKIRLDTLGTETYKNITKVLGVLFDNAIDACKKSKDKKIIIDVVKKTNLVTFSIYNTYKGKIDMDKIGTGFTTKGSGHGYGLRLVKDIIESSNIFEIENALEDEYYVTKLTIKTKKKQIKKKK